MSVVEEGGCQCQELILSPESAFEYQLLYGYSLTSTKGEGLTADNEGELDVIMSKAIELRKDGEIVYTAEIPDGRGERQNAFLAVKPYLVEHEGEGKTEWMRKEFCGTDADLPPWKRKRATRNYKKYTEEGILETLNDDGNATRFEQEAGGYLIFDPDKGTRGSGEWYAWLRNHWAAALEKLGLVERFIGFSLREEVDFWEREYQKADSTKDIVGKSYVKKLEKVVNSLKSHMTQSKNQTRQQAMTKMAGKSTMQIRLDEVTDYNIIAFKNGAIDCKTGEMFEIWECEKLKERYPMTYIDAEYISGAKASKFKHHIFKIFEDNTTPNLSEDEIFDKTMAIGNYFLRLLGYMMIAGNPEEIFVFWWGEGANGKSKTVEILSIVLGEQHAEAPISDIGAGNIGRPAAKTAYGLTKRLLTFSEASGNSGEKAKDAKISLAAVKIISGETKTNWFRPMFRDSVDTRINCLPVGITNELPTFDKELDYAALRRIVTIPFLHKFEGEERNKDIIAELKEEKDEIFSVMIDQMKLYLKEGLLPAPEACIATRAELLAGRIYKVFVETEYEKTEGKDWDDRAKKTDVKRHFLEWCDERDIEVGTTQILDKEDAYGYSKKLRTITQKESRKLYNAFKVCGIKDDASHGTPYFCCKRKNQ